MQGATKEVLDDVIFHDSSESQQCEDVWCGVGSYCSPRASLLTKCLKPMENTQISFLHTQHSLWPGMRCCPPTWSWSKLIQCTSTSGGPSSPTPVAWEDQLDNTGVSGLEKSSVVSVLISVTTDMSPTGDLLVTKKQIISNHWISFFRWGRWGPAANEQLDAGLDTAPHCDVTFHFFGVPYLVCMCFGTVGKHTHTHTHTHMCIYIYRYIYTHLCNMYI